MFSNSHHANLFNRLSHENCNLCVTDAICSLESKCEKFSWMILILFIYEWYAKSNLPQRDREEEHDSRSTTWYQRKITKFFYPMVTEVDHSEITEIGRSNLGLARELKDRIDLLVIFIWILAARIDSRWQGTRP